jgi:ribose/xylose/arabinose/galactoside ABC-type transport system permease subunit
VTMLQRTNTLISKYRRFIPLTVTAVLVFVAYGVGAILFPAMRNPQVFFNLFRNNAYLLISAIGMTFVILTGGIDLSVSGVVALTTVASAALLRNGWNAWVVILLMLLMGMSLGATMGSIITFMKVQPFIATLAGMWFARGMCFFISDDAIAIDNPIYRLIGETKLLIPGLTELAKKQGNSPPYITIFVAISFLLLGFAIYIAHFRRFGRTVYSIGGYEGRNEQSARLMGLSVNTTKVLVYTFNGFCSGLAGIALGVFVSSGHGLYATGFELDVIASVVIGGTMLTGGEGYVFGTLFGVMVIAITQVLIQFIGSLSSWWTKIVIGLLMLVFIGIQSYLASRKGGRPQKQWIRSLVATPQRRWALVFGIGALVLISGLSIYFAPSLFGIEKNADTGANHCAVLPFREEEVADLIKNGAVIAYHRAGGTRCVDELYAIYPDGRVVANNGEQEVEGQVDPNEVQRILKTISDDYGWFTEKMYSTYHNPCGTCYTHYLTISYNGQEKTVTAVDGGVDMQAEYGYTLSLIRPLLPKFNQ